MSAEKSERLLGGVWLSDEERVEAFQLPITGRAPSESKAEESVSFLSTFKNISKKAIQMGLSFTFNFEGFLLIPLLHLLNDSEDDAAASALASSMMMTVGGLAMSPVFSVPGILIEKIGEWKNYEEKKREEKIEGHENCQGNDRAIVEIPSAPISAKEMPIDKPEFKKIKAEEIEKIGTYSLSYATIISILAWVPLFFSEIFLSFSQPDSVSASAARFLRPYSFSMPGLIIRASIEQFMFSFNKVEEAMRLAIWSFAIGIAVAVFLGFYGAQFLDISGEAGIAIGFVLESYLTAYLYYDFVKNDKDCKEFNFYRKPSWEMFSTWTDDLSTLVKRGADQAVNFGIDFSLFLVMTFLSGSVAKKDQAAMSYNLQYMNLELMFSAAFAFTCTRAVSTELSNKKFISAEMTSEYGLLSTLLCLTPIPAILAVACAFSPKILGASAELEDTLQTLVPIMCAGVIFETARFGLLHQLRTTGDTFTPNMIAFGMLSCGMGLSAALGLKTSLGVNGVGLGYAAGNAGTVAVLLPRKRNKLKELSKKEEQKTGLPKLAVTISDKVVGKFAKRNGAAVMSIVVQAPDANANNTSNASTLTAVRVGEKEPAVDSRPS